MAGEATVSICLPANSCANAAPNSAADLVDASAIAHCRYTGLCRPLDRMKCPSSKAPALLNFANTSSAVIQPVVVCQRRSPLIVSKNSRQRLQCSSVASHRNLVSDSALVQETFDLLSKNGGRASLSDIVDVIFRMSHADQELAA